MISIVSLLAREKARVSTSTISGSPKALQVRTKRAALWDAFGVDYAPRYEPGCR
jgi:hypothetical protein